VIAGPHHKKGLAINQWRQTTLELFFIDDVSVATTYKNPGLVSSPENMFRHVSDELKSYSAHIQITIC